MNRTKEEVVELLLSNPEYFWHLVNAYCLNIAFEVIAKTPEAARLLRLR